MTTYLPEQIHDLIYSNPTVSLGSVKYTGPGGKGGCKELLINGETICIVIPCETRKLETSHRFKMTLFISKLIHDQVSPICEYISKILDTNIKPFCWSYNKEGSSKVSHYATCRLMTSKDGNMYTKLYTGEGGQIENSHEWPTSFSGHVSLRLDGVYIDNFKSRNAKVSFVVTTDEILAEVVQINIEQGSKIKRLLSTTVDSNTDPVSDDEDLW